MLRPTLRAPAMLTLCVIFAGLAAVRVPLGVMQGDFSAYTLFAMGFEVFCVAYTAWWLRGNAQPAG